MALRSLVCLVASVAAWLLHGWNHEVSTALFMVAYAAGGWDLAQDTWAGLKHWHFDTHFLMLLVVPCTAALGLWGEGALLLILFSGSAAMETYAMGRTKSAIKALLRGAPKTATVLGPDGPREVPVEQVAAGQRIRVAPGQQVPVDMKVEGGESACDESSLTGESEPVVKQPGETALAGTLNLWGNLEGPALRAAAESTLQKIIRLIERSQEMRAPSQRLADRFGSRYTGLVITACVLLWAVSWLWLGLPFFFPEGGKVSAFYRAMTLLVVMSPCALVLSVPSAILSAVAFGARHGVLFRGGAAIETLAEVQVVALDKTGTLTEGKFKVETVETWRGTEEVALGLAGALARLSTHPVSRAVAAEAERRGLKIPDAAGLENVPGKGMTAVVAGQKIKIGNRAMVIEGAAGLPFSQAPDPPEGATELWVDGGGVFARVVLRDTLRVESRGLLAQLHGEGLRTVMLTGDQPAAAQRIATQCGVGEVRAGLHPEEKVAAVEALKEGGKVRVAMIGDGVNDAPSLAAADVAVAMGARGSDAAIEQADVVLMHDRLENFLLARDLSHRARSIIKQNLTISIGVMSVMAVATILSKNVPLAFGVAMHEGSTAVVVLNSLRLLLNHTRPKPKE